MNKGDQQRLKELLRQCHNHTLPQHHQKELLALLEQQDASDFLKEDINDAPGHSGEVFHTAQKEAMLKMIINHRQPKRFAFRYVATAAVLLIAVLITFFKWQQPGEKQRPVAKGTGTSSTITDIAAPASNKAILTLADGRQIVLEKTGQGSIAIEGTINVTKSSDDHLVYSGIGTEMQQNTLTVPKGSKPIRLTLSDGSRVILNAASSLTYPVAFADNIRNVIMTGEAYFDVAPISSVSGYGKRPFIVNTNDISVEVKGTKFNVNAYEDEGAIKTTLVEGAVKIAAGKQQSGMAPGEQAIISRKVSERIRLEKNANVDEAVAWTNGKFRFHNADVETVMRQVARWYDVDVKFAAKPRLRFGGQIDRNSTLRQMLTILETSGLHFSINESVVTILK